MSKCDSKYCSCLYYTSNALSRIMTRMADEEFSVVGLSASYAFLLMTVNDNPGIQPKDISQKMLLTPSTVTRLIEKMEYRKLLERKQNGRSTEVFPTQQSLDMQPKIKDAWRALYQRYSNLLGEEKGKQLTQDIMDSIDLLEE